MYYLTEDIINSIQLRAFVPISQTTFVNPTDFLTLMNEEMMLNMVPMIQSVREDFFATTKDVSIVANIDHYSVPERAIGNALQDVYYVDGQGNLMAPLPKVSRHNIDLYFRQGVVPVGVYLEGDEIVLLPQPIQSTGVIRLRYYERPNKLVATSSCAKITAVTTLSGTTTFTVDTDLTASLSVGSLVDFQSAKSPFKLWAMDVAITGITSTTIAVSSTGVDDANSSILPIVGDYIAPAQSCNIPMLPSEFHPLLAQMVAVRMLEALGDIQKIQVAAANMDRMKQACLMLIRNRIENAVDHVVNRAGFLQAMGQYARMTIR